METKQRGEGNALQNHQTTSRDSDSKHMTGLIYNIGVNDLDYRTQVLEELPSINGKRVRKPIFLCKYYTVWKDMLERCYSEKFLKSRPSYVGTSVCEEWLQASVFKCWMRDQDWAGKCLDKDIIVAGSKLYSPETCAFVLKSTNSFVVASDASRGDYPIGVSLFKRTGKYRAYCKNLFTGKEDHLGYFLTTEEAHEAWRRRKHELAQLVAATESDPRVVEALKIRYSIEEWYK